MKIALIIFTLLLSCLSLKSEDNRYVNTAMGLSFEKPDKWHYVEHAEYKEYIKHVQLEDKKLQELLHKHDKIPFNLQANQGIRYGWPVWIT